SFERLVAIGKIVRSAVQVSRVIVVGGRGYDREGILHHVVRRGDQQGVDTPGLGVYDKNYMVRHLGLGVDVQQQVPTILNAAGFPVVLLGKAADVVECEGAALRPVVDSTQVTESALSFFDELDGGLIVVNYQESDLAGHEQDAGRYARVLKVIDEGVGEFLARLTEDDLLIVTGDHGNDPGIRHSRHTREYTPLLVYGRSLRGCQLGTRETLADVAATLSDFFGVKPPQFGRSFYGQLMP
ncbi:MAG: phosphopentomutase, partial [Bacillota bacterium]